MSTIFIILFLSPECNESETYLEERLYKKPGACTQITPGAYFEKGRDLIETEILDNHIQETLH